MDIETRKQLYNEHVNCKFMKVTKAGQASIQDIIVDYVLVDKYGNVFVEWHSGTYSDSHFAEVNMVNQAFDNYISGIFTDEATAKAVAAEWFDRQKQEKIAELEAELKKLKES